MMCAAPEISHQMHNRPLPVPTPPPQASHRTIPDSVGLFQHLLATQAKSWAPSSQPVPTSWAELEAFSALWGSVCPSGPLPTSPPLPSPAQKPTCSVVKSCSAGVWMLLSSPLGWGWSSPHLLFSMAVSLVTLRGAIPASASLVPGDLCRWRGGQE